MSGSSVKVEERLLKDICKDVCDILRAEGLLDDSFGLAPLIGMDHKAYNSRKWPDHYQWVSVYPVVGASEGHYLHVDIINGPGPMHDDVPREMIFLGKTFMGWDFAWKQAKRVAELLGA